MTRPRLTVVGGDAEDPMQIAMYAANIPRRYHAMRLAEEFPGHEGLTDPGRTKGRLDNGAGVTVIGRLPAYDFLQLVARTSLLLGYATCVAAVDDLAAEFMASPDYSEEEFIPRGIRELCVVRFIDEAYEQTPLPPMLQYSIESFLLDMLDNEIALSVHLAVGETSGIERCADVEGWWSPQLMERLDRTNEVIRL